MNPIDWKTCSGGGASSFIEALPFCPGWEFAGRVEALGDGVNNVRQGDEVMGFIRFPQPAGCYAEYLIAPADQICQRPSALDSVTAAGLGLAGLTAWQALFEAGELKEVSRFWYSQLRAASAIWQYNWRSGKAPM